MISALKPAITLGILGHWVPGTALASKPSACISSHASTNGGHELLLLEEIKRFGGGNH